MFDAGHVEFVLNRLERGGIVMNVRHGGNQPHRGRFSTGHLRRKAIARMQIPGRDVICCVAFDGRSTLRESSRRGDPPWRSRTGARDELTWGHSGALVVLR